MEYTLDRITTELADQAQQILGVASIPGVQPANPKFGADFAIPCFEFARELGDKPQLIAERLASELHNDALAKTEATAGFVNIWLSDDIIIESLSEMLTKGDEVGLHATYQSQTVLIEHTDPNPFKEFHIGHAYSNTVGETLGRLYAAGGAEVHQISYHGDVGIHIANAIWGMQQLLAKGEGGWFEPEAPERTLSDVLAEQRIAFMGAAYAHGATAFKNDEHAADDIKKINKHIYAHDEEDIDELYETGKAWSFEYFEDIYARLGTGFEKNYLESEVGPEGAEIVKKYIGSVFEESDGAIIYRGEKADLHTRVFINGEGLPTYEAKELGLTFAKKRDYEVDQSVVVTANEIDEYFKVLIAAMGEIDPQLAAKMVHISHGMVKLTSGKMSSRTGQVVKATDVLDEIREAIVYGKGFSEDTADAVTLGALKYAFLKPRVGGNIVFDINESISLDGNSGPYLQYAHARGCSILAKLDSHSGEITDLTEAERRLAAKILAYPAITARAIAELAPHHICNYLYELTQVFNHFYEHNRIVGDKRETQRAQLVRVYVQVLRSGLGLLNIPAPERM